IRSGLTIQLLDNAAAIVTVKVNQGNTLVTVLRNSPLNQLPDIQASFQAGTTSELVESTAGNQSSQSGLKNRGDYSEHLSDFSPLFTRRDTNLCLTACRLLIKAPPPASLPRAASWYRV